MGRTSEPGDSIALQNAQTLQTMKNVIVMSASTALASQKDPDVVASASAARKAPSGPNRRRTKTNVIPTPAMPLTAAGNAAVHSFTSPGIRERTAIVHM